MTPVIFIPAAGQSSRMRGRDKLLEIIDGEPLLRRQARIALSTGCPVIVGLPPGGGKRREALDGLELTILEITDSAEGLGATLRTAAAEIDGRAMAVLLPDVPGVGADDIEAVLAVFDGNDSEHVVRASDATGRPGTPLILPSRLVSRFSDLEGDEGGRQILSTETVINVPLPDNRATRDLDTPEDWADWRRDRH